ncbi:MAG: DUF308 domain-containing protein [Corallococcus sp.]|nr:DUF308 domain-containing protein [Corallococcus sp.]
MDKNALKEWFKGNTGKIIISLFEIVIGILLFFDPIGFTNGIVIAFGVVMLLLGLVNIVKYFTTKTEIATTERALFSGLLLSTIGCLCVFKPEWFTNAISVISVIYGIVLALLGLNSIQATANMLRLKNKKWFLELINAIIMIAFAVIIFVNPFGAGKGIWIFTGIVLIVGAIYNIATLAILSKSEKKVENSETTEQ